MPIKYLKKAIKTPSSDDNKTRATVQSILNDIEKRREESIKEITKKFDKYEGEIIVHSLIHQVSVSYSPEPSPGL